jgi:predicted RNase H-like HicB family nuclease
MDLYSRAEVEPVVERDTEWEKEILMRYYFAWVEQEGDSAYRAQFPDLLNVFSAAEKHENVIQEACDALRLAAQDSILPLPSDHAAIVRRDDVRDALAKGACLIQVPLIEIGTEVVRANITLERAMLDAIDFAAKGRGLTRSAFLVNSARHEIEV